MATAADNDRLESLFREHYPAVLAYARRRASHSVADDVAAETFTVAWRRADAVPAEPLPWLLGVARRVLATQRRAQARRLRLQHRLRSAAGSWHADSPLVEGRVAQALGALSEGDREAILLVAWEGLTARQAASVLGITPTNVYVRLHRGRRRLRAQLGTVDQFGAEPGGVDKRLHRPPAIKGNAQ